MVLSEINERLSAFHTREGDEGEHAEGLWHENVGDGAIFGKIRFQIFLGDIFRHATHENATTQMRLRLLLKCMKECEERKGKKRKTERERKPRVDVTRARRRKEKAGKRKTKKIYNLFI